MQRFNFLLSALVLVLTLSIGVRSSRTQGEGELVQGSGTRLPRTINLPPVLFEHRSLEIRSEAISTLRQIDSTLRRYDFSVLVTGHTDPSEGSSHQERQSLAYQRAIAVKSWLVNGNPALGKGERLRCTWDLPPEFEIAPASFEAQERNRKVDFRIAETISPTAYLRFDPIPFSEGSADLSEEAIVKLRTVDSLTSQYRGFRMAINGYAETGERPTAELRKELSWRRSLAVQKWLSDRASDPSRYESHGLGDESPRTEGSGAEAKAASRRVEIKMLLPGRDE